ncbi:MAG: FKBP-type peptidyl-prolyl cis-trans isomerase [Methanomicrobiaceae archaeon]|nr:FKBP-type peptidyl-prolyl cis-trans isomerase [Methanomicrobiaceae archaeon]
MQRPWDLLLLILLCAASLAAGCLDGGQAPSQQVEGPAAQVGDTVRVHSTCTLQNGAVVESTTGGEPFELTICSGAMYPRFEAALVGMRPQETKVISIPPAELWGDEAFTLDKEKILTTGELRVGQTFSGSRTAARSSR